MCDLGAKDAESASLGWKARFVRGPIPMLPQKSVASQQETHVVRLRATGGESSIGVCGKAGLCAEPANQLLLYHGSNGRLVEGIHRLVERADHDLGGERGQQRRAMQVRSRV